MAPLGPHPEGAYPFPRNTLLIFLVRPSGFGTCRALEFWARTHHYAVNWYPNGHKQTFVFHMVNSVQRQ